MNLIYDIVLNYAKWNETYDFFEWNQKDNLTYIEKIPIFKISSQRMEEILKYRIKISQEILNKIHNKTFSSIGIIPYSLLFTDRTKVIALSFSKDGILEEKSNLLLDEEEAVIMESEDFALEEIQYEKLEKYPFSFLTRKEKEIQKYLIKKINYLYETNNYEEIDYLYKEIFNKQKSPQEEYKALIESINNNFKEKYNSLCEIIKLAEK